MGYLEDRAHLEGKVAAVIGGAGGVGGAATFALARSGVDVAFCDTNAAAVDAMTATLGDLSPRSRGSIADAWDPGQLSAFYDAFDRQFDHLDILVNVVGSVRPRAFSDTTPEQWTRDIHRNLLWAIQSTSLALPRIRASGRGGSIIGFTTIEAHRGAAGYAAYAGAKAGLENFSRSLAVELGPERIRVNLIAPDTSPSDSVSKMMTPEALQAMGASREALDRAFAVYIPMGAPPPVDDIGDAVLFLASDLSSSITGTTLHVDGGTWAASGFLHWGETRKGWRWGPAPPPDLFQE